MSRPATLSLFIGPVIPLQAPRFVLEALAEVTVTAGTGETDGFELKFSLANDATALQAIFLVAGGGVPKIIRVVIAVEIAGRSTVLMDGIVTQAQVAPDTGAGPTQLIVKGGDLGELMDSVDFSGLFPYPATPLEGRVALILAKYMAFGIVPMIIPTPTVDVNNPLTKIEQHWGTDLVYLRNLAELVGYTFTIEPGPVVGASVGYWGPVLRIGPVQKALSVDMDAETNVESISCTFDADEASMPIVSVENPITRTPSIPIPLVVNPLDPPLGLVPPIPKRFPIVADSAKEDFARALMWAWADQAASNRSVRAEGRIDALRYGEALKPRRLVGLRGVGAPFDGLYFTERVTSTLKRGQFSQSFSLVRNGLISTMERIPV